VLGGPAKFVSAGDQVTCALLTSGRLRCWGRATAGALGYGNKNNIGDNETPASAGDVPVGDVVEQVSVGSGPTCAVLPQGRLRCWGAYGFGFMLKCWDPGVPCSQLTWDNLGIGYDTWRPIGDDESPASMGDLPVRGGGVQSVASGWTNICVVLESGSVRCWGHGSDGQTGDSGVTSPSETGPNIRVGGPSKQVVTGYWHTCALLRNGHVRCWGTLDKGRLGYGYGGSQSSYDPVNKGDVSIGGGRVVQITAGESHTCALLQSGRVRCWGDNEHGQLGYVHRPNVGLRDTAASVGDVNVGGKVTQISAGGNHTCALLDTGRVRCWGENSYGQLGYGHKRDIGDDEVPASAGDVPL
jgi:alpha-tubulin suppressor-like RCC1 family protein